ncbi:MAG: glycerophosphodiester phosphodiesterase, partial [Thermoplasmata archaeon]
DNKFAQNIYFQNNITLTMEIVGHRGLPISHVENTIGSFEDAFKNGADAVELDVHLSSDHVPIVFHDFDLKRLLNMDEKIYELSLSEIQKIKLGNDHIPTLYEVVKKFGDKKIYVELKTIDDYGKRYNEALPEILHKNFNNYRNLVFISFDPKSLEEMRSYSEKYILGLDYEKNSEKILPFDVLEKFIEEFNLEYLLPDIKILDNFVKLNNEKIKLAPWTVNDISIIKNYAKNLYGIISDRCDIIRKQVTYL